MRFTAYVLVCLIVVAGIFFGRCKSSEKPTAGNTLNNDTILLASIERTPCFGICPVYKTVIYRSGYAIMHGKRNVPNIGRFSTRLTQEQVKSIIRFAEENKIFDLEGEYIEPRIADFPTTITELNIHGRYKRIVNTQPSAPEVLLHWEKFLDSFFNEHTQWQLMNDPQGEE
ncbi:MAG: hypothetical protein JNL47_02870 [Bacteroidia bacterium]|nr:hypothetical protein [Bacteroidia bacterium]